MLDRVGPAAYRVWFGDGTHLDLLNDEAAMAAQLEGVERGAGEGFRWAGRAAQGRGLQPAGSGQCGSVSRIRQELVASQPHMHARSCPRFQPQPPTPPARCRPLAWLAQALPEDGAHASKHGGALLHRSRFH